MNLIRSALTPLRSSILCLLVALLALGGEQALSEEATLAVASNFQPAMEELQTIFERSTGHRLKVSYGATGQFYAQIELGAPYHMFLSADAVRPALLSSQSQTVSQPPRTYAIGKLALWSPDAASLTAATLAQSDFRFLAIANADLAPYGAAGREVIDLLDMADVLQKRIVQGNNVGQAFVFVQTGNAELGFVALSQILSLPEPERGAHWLPPPELYTPIRQDAVLLERGALNDAATDFFAFLFSDEARRVIERAGYAVP